MIDLFQLLLGQIPEAIYFALFLIYSKNIKNKRLIFIVLMIFEYILLKHFIHFNIWFQVLYTFTTYSLLKILYKDKAQITDIFTFMISSVYLIIVSSITYLVFNFTSKNMIIAVALSRLLEFIPVFILNYKLHAIQSVYKKLWNRNDKVKKKVKSITFRCINLLLFNIMFYFLNAVMLYCIMFYEKR